MKRKPLIYSFVRTTRCIRKAAAKLVAELLGALRAAEGTQMNRRIVVDIDDMAAFDAAERSAYFLKEAIESLEFAYMKHDASSDYWYRSRSRRRS